MARQLASNSADQWLWPRQHAKDSALPFSYDRVAVLVPGRATAKQAQSFRAGVPKFVLSAGWDGDGVADAHVFQFTFDSHSPAAVSDVVNLFGFGMVMFHRAGSDGQPCFGETLIANG